MPYKLAYPVWLAAQVEKVRGLLLQNMEHPQAYPVVQVRMLCRKFGLHYSNPEYDDILAALVADGFLEQSGP